MARASRIVDEVEETPAGAIDGVNRTFSLTRPVARTALYLNGVRLRAGPAADYVLSGATITLSTLMIPTPGDSLSAVYSY